MRAIFTFSGRPVLSCFGLLLATLAIGCGGGVPVQILVDEFERELSIDDAMTTAETELKARGVLPQEGVGLPELWPDTLPDVHYPLELVSPPMPVDLTPDVEEDAEKYEQINKASQVLKRIEINRLVLRVERSTLTVPLPDLELQMSDDKDANPDDRTAWVTIGSLDGIPAGEVSDLPFEWAIGGESYLNAQLAEEEREFAIRVKGSMDIDTTENPKRPRGIASLRLILLATFFIDPTGAL